MSDKTTVAVESSSGLPRHIAIIMDGNGRWAEKQGLSRSEGHAAGAESLRRAARYCRKLGVKYLTVYAFSTENWKRPAGEVAGIIHLLEQYVMEMLDIMEEEKTRILFLGDLNLLPPRLRRLCRECMEKSAGYTSVQLNICFNYGGRDEIVRAAKRWAEDGCPALTEESFGNYLWSAGIPDPDLLIRPGGEMRISNFLLWQLAYTEMYFSEVLWPDFDEAEIDKAVAAFQSRMRRFGGV